MITAIMNKSTNFTSYVFCYKRLYMHMQREVVMVQYTPEKFKEKTEYNYVYQICLGFFFCQNAG